MKKLSVLILSALLLCGCADNKVRTKDIFAMDTYMTLRAYGKNAAEALEASEAEIKRLEELFSVTREGSDIWNINISTGGAVSVSPETAELIGASADMYKKTDGALNIALYPISREWGFTTGDYKIPDDGTITDLLGNTDAGLIKVSGNSVAVPCGMQLDLGAAAKGYASDRVKDILYSYGASSAVISLGGNVWAIGSKPDGSQWRIGIADPFSPDREIAALSLTDKAAVTSGSYQRYFDGGDGKRYCHIIDPASGRPADNGLVSVTVVGENGLMCDALSTALFVMGYEKAAEYHRDNGGFDMIMITSDKKIYITEGIKNSAVFAKGYSAEVIG